MIDRDELLCSIKCTQVGCLAFYVDEATKECKLGTINDQSERSDSGIKAYMQIDNDGNPTAGKSPTCSGKILFADWTHRESQKKQSQVS